MTSGIGGAAAAAIKSVGSLFGEGSVAQQFLIWGVLQQIAGAALTPATNDIQQAVNALDPNLTLTPEQLAVGVARGLLDAGNSESEAAKSGIGAGRFAQLQTLAKQPPALSMILAAYQRSQSATGGATDAPVDIDTALADLGIEENYWPLVKALSIEIPTVQQVMNAWLQGQIEETEANARYLAAGGDPSWFQTSYNAQGEAPTPVEALEMLNRGLIPQEGTGPAATSYAQAFLEGPWRNKWEPAFLGLRYYLPPPRTVTALLKEGSITEAQATQYLQAQGLDSTLTAIYLAAASHTTTVAQRELSQAQVIDAYESQLLTHDEALADLVALKFSTSDATLLLALADKKTAVASTKQAVSRIRSLFLVGTDTAVTARNALQQLGLQAAQVASLIATWQLEQATVVRTLTAPEIASAFYYEFFTQATATRKLVALGFSTSDAQLVLALRIKALLPGMVQV